MTGELFVSRIGSQTWAALCEGGSLVELRVEDDADRDAVGQIVKARVVRLLPGIESAFVDVGQDRDAYLHASELVLPEAADPRADRRRPLEQRLRVGQDLLVQIDRDAFRAKGARVTCQIALAGRYLVYLPMSRGCRISRRVHGAAERERLDRVIAEPGDTPGGWIVRTAAAGLPASRLIADRDGLLAQWQEVRRQAQALPAPGVLHREPELALRLLRDAHGERLETVHLDDEELYHRALEQFREVDPELVTRIRYQGPAGTLFETKELGVEIDRALRPRVWLRSGGYLVIEQTEALVSIDVNTGKFVGQRVPQETILQTNLEAAAELARQLRLRDLGGIIVVDFIDMTASGHRRQVMDELQRALLDDRSRTKLLHMSELGLVQLTRKRSRRGLESRLMRACPTCAGHGRVKSPQAVAAEALAELRRMLPLLNGQQVTLRAAPEVAREIEVALHGSGGVAERAGGAHVQVEQDAGMRPDHFDLLAV